VVENYNFEPWPALAEQRSPEEIRQPPEQPPSELARKHTPAAARLPALEPGYGAPARRRSGPRFWPVPCSRTVWLTLFVAAVIARPAEANTFLSSE
jgi:hypothetical protein